MHFLAFQAWTLAFNLNTAAPRTTHTHGPCGQGPRAQRTSPAHACHTRCTLCCLIRFIHDDWRTTSATHAHTPRVEIPFIFVTIFVSILIE